MTSFPARRAGRRNRAQPDRRPSPRRPRASHSAPGRSGHPRPGATSTPSSSSGGRVRPGARSDDRPRQARAPGRCPPPPRLEPDVDPGPTEQELRVPSPRGGELGVDRARHRRALPGRQACSRRSRSTTSWPACAGLDRGRDPGRAAPDDRRPGPAARPGSGRGSVSSRPVRGFCAQRDRSRRVVVGDAGVAGDAADDALDVAVTCLPRQVGIGDERARHPDGVGPPLGDQPVGFLRIDDARGRDQRRAVPKRLCPLGDRVLDCGGGGTIPVEPRYVEESPSATWTKSARPVSSRDRPPAPPRSRPRDGSPIASRPADSRTAASTASEEGRRLGPLVASGDSAPA